MAFSTTKPRPKVFVLRRAIQYLFALTAHHSSAIRSLLRRSAWPDRLSSLSPDAALATDIDAFLDNGSADPAGFMRSLFDRAGVGYEQVGERIVLTFSAR